MSILCFIALRIITRHNSPAEAIAYGRQIVAEMCANSTKRLPDDFLQRSVMSAFLLRILQKANYFGHRTSDSGKFQITMITTSVVLQTTIIININQYLFSLFN